MHAIGTEGALAVSLVEMLMRFIMMASTTRTPVDPILDTGPG
ncbi:hypothetical protein [Mesorhizobium sp. LNJC405B00]|nr:hypothetical protein [Mesorhizobium sp. LNJC405B00]ESY01480.1 hypothetical protein X755_06515 [Mesorhizobium sp. LNJC405B00]